MNKAEQQEFMINLCDSAKEYFLKKMKNVPENWDGFELREWFANTARDHFAWTKMSRGRKADYNNNFYINDL